MKSLRSKIIIAAFLQAITGTAAAHHNTSAVFDVSQDVAIEGVITAYEWKNPHLYFFVEAGGEDGVNTVWRIEAGPLALMRRMGWSRDSLQAGQHVSMVVNPSRRAGRTSAFLKSITADGVELPSFQSEEAREGLGVAGPESETRAESLAGTWVTVRNRDVLGGFRARDRFGLTAAGQASVDAYDENTMHPGLECIPFAAPYSMLLPDTKSIDINEERIRIRSDFDSAERLVYLRNAGEDAPASVQGHSVGHWEGSQFIVETTAFADHRSGNGPGLQSGPNKWLREEFELHEDGKGLSYRFEFGDPDYMQDSYSGQAEWSYRPEIEYESLECDLSNSRYFLQD